ncbi:histamine H2 receptor-like [Lytechinus variegatus]|uniref:histamine H2 receptor-like n=1 Tax=Lytechinus variegatus TaxID=7654 RepID=UPI001BB1DFD2|nr:histamine H2 receptor-like [Lytechinus variegatus]
MEYFESRNLSIHTFHDSTIHRVIVSILLGPLTAIVIIGNALVILTVCSRPKLQKLNYIILTSLAVNDFLTGLISIPLEIHLRTIRSELTCTLRSAEWFFIWSYVFVFGSLTHLLLVSTDRYIAVTRPLRHEAILTPSRIAILITIAWCIPACYGIARITVNRSQTNDDFYSYCLGKRGVSNGGIASIVFDLIVPISVFVVGFILIILNIHVLLIAFRQSNRIADMTRALDAHHQNANNENNNARHVKATKIILSMVASFLVCFLPTGLFLGLATRIDDDVWYVTADDVAYSLFCVSSALNPIIYCSRDRVFRVNLIEFIHSLKIAVQNSVR